MMNGVQQAVRDEFGKSLGDQEFKFPFDEYAKRVTITIPAFSVLALKPWMSCVSIGGGCPGQFIARHPTQRKSWRRNQ